MSIDCQQDARATAWIDHFPQGSKLRRIWGATVIPTTTEFAH